MNFAAFSTANAAGTHFVTTTGQLPVNKLQQNVASNGSTLQQVVGMVGSDGGVQYVRADGLQAAPQLITLPISLPGAKPGDPQSTVQIQVLSPNILQQQPKYQMQIPIQGFQQGGAVLTVAYSPDNNDAGIQVLGNSLPEGLQMLAALPQDMQLVQQMQDNKEQIQQTIQHQVFITPNQQIVINGPEDTKLNNNNTITNNNQGVTNIVIKEECDDNANDDESSQGTESSENMQWQISSTQQDLIKYLNQFQPQQPTLPVSLQQFLRINPADGKKEPTVEIEVLPMDQDKEPMAEAVVGEDGSLTIQPKKKKKYKKKAPKPARPKPGQVVIASAADGSPIYCCPRCHLAYPDKEQLELHLSVHDIERRFICGLCGAGLKRKEHLERHKLGHNPERPYVCGVCRKGFKRREHLNLHAVIHSGVKTEVCPECGKGFYRKDHLRKHMRSHESKRLRDDAAEGGAGGVAAAGAAPAPSPAPSPGNNSVLPEITIHVPTSSNMQPVQINIPQHVVSALQARAAADTRAAHQHEHEHEHEHS
ncbi:zinc finger protein 853-like isoform X4 [Cydia pomonella]|uniref:zinc finger protein 853-like isoform X3 n=1 Tax=Cydia pomonella TaxID=82600 RepID=UPI002ADD5BE3|nr:zinc finger protein 853-like isoform X3 [Cydia pomonella]XP_061713751.1 zinc finger protein 853-like isoform X4 [Cydia pomonella]